jgi:hypothetical protein
MPKRTIVFRLVALAALLTAGFVFGWPTPEAQAQETTRSYRIKPGTLDTYRVPGPSVGGYSMTLSDVWGLPEMPPAPKDFGPHFDFPAGGNISLQGPPDHSPYPN